MKKSTNKQHTELVMQRRVFKISWLFMPLGLCGVMFPVVQIGFENYTNMSTGLAALLSALIVAPLSVFTYKYAVVQKVECRKERPSELIFVPKLFAGGMLLAFVVICIQLAVVSVWGDLSISISNQALEGLANALGIAIFAGVLEELFGRGVVFRISEKYIGSLLAIIGSALIFGLPHMFNPSATVLTGLAITLEAGVMFALVFIVTRNLWATMGIHIGWNFGVTLLGLGDIGAFTTTLTGPSWLIGTGYGIEESAIVVGIWSLVSVVFLAIAIKQSKLISYKKACKQKHPI